MTYFRAVDPYPLESADQSRLHEFYARLAAGRLSTTACGGCGRIAWPPRGFCPECGDDRVEWRELSGDGVVQAFTVQETGVPAGFAAPRVFAVVTVDGHRIFTVLVDADPTTLHLGQRVRFTPLRVEDDPVGTPRWLAAFRPA
jgi:uncharacterized OB-fold protein